MSAEVWRVVHEDGSVREVRIEELASTGTQYAASWADEEYGGHRSNDYTQRRAIARLLGTTDNCAAEVLRPGEPTRAEAIEAAKRAAIEACADTVERVGIDNMSADENECVDPSRAIDAIRAIDPATIGDSNEQR